MPRFTSGGGVQRTEKFVVEGGDTAPTFLTSGTNGVGTPHNIERQVGADQIHKQGGLVAEWVGGW